MQPAKRRGCARCRLCSDARMYQMITSGLMAGSAGEAAERIVQPANAGASLEAQAVRDAGLITSNSSIPCSQKTR